MAGQNPGKSDSILEKIIQVSNATTTLNGVTSVRPVINIGGVNNVQANRISVQSFTAAKLESGDTRGVLYLGLNTNQMDSNLPQSNVTGLGVNVVSDSNSQGIANDVFVGSAAGSNAQSVYTSVFVGSEAGRSLCNVSGSVYIGQRAGSGLTSTDPKHLNVAVGLAAGRSALGSANVYLGAEAGLITSGDSNIFIGKDAGKSTSTATGRLLVTNTSDASLPLLDGFFPANTTNRQAYLGIGKTPTQGGFNLDVSGDARLNGRLVLDGAIPLWTASSNSLTVGLGGVTISQGHLLINRSALSTYTVDVSGSQRVTRDVALGGQLDVCGGVFALGDGSFGRRLTVSGTSTFNGEVTVKNNVSLLMQNESSNSVVKIGGPGDFWMGLSGTKVGINRSTPFVELDVSGAIRSLSAVSIGGRLSVSGDAVVGGSFSTQGLANVGTLVTSASGTNAMMTASNAATGDSWTLFNWSPSNQPSNRAGRNEYWIEPTYGGLSGPVYGFSASGTHFYRPIWSWASYDEASYSMNNVYSDANRVQFSGLTNVMGSLRVGDARDVTSNVPQYRAPTAALTILKNFPYGVDGRFNTIRWADIEMGSFGGGTTNFYDPFRYRMGARQVTRQSGGGEVVWALNSINNASNSYDAAAATESPVLHIRGQPGANVFRFGSDEGNPITLGNGQKCQNSIVFPSYAAGGISNIVHLETGTSGMNFKAAQGGAFMDEYGQLNVSGSISIGDGADGYSSMKFSATRKSADAVTEMYFLPYSAVNRGFTDQILGEFLWRRNGTTGQGSNYYVGIRAVQNAGFTDNLRIGFTTNAGPNNNTQVERLTINTNGRVGIGTTTPRVNLDIPGGTIRCHEILLTNAADNLASGVINGLSNINCAGFQSVHITGYTGNPNPNRLRFDTAGGITLLTNGASTEAYQLGYDADGNYGVGAGVTLLGLGAGSGYINAKNGYKALLFAGQSYGGLFLTDVNRVVRVKLFGNSGNVELQNSDGVNKIAIYGFNGVAYATSWVSNSDRRLKTQIAPLTEGLATVQRLKPSTYVWKDESVPGTQIGFVAQDVQEVLPTLVSDNSGNLALNYTGIIPVLTKAIQELSEKVAALEAKLA